MSLACARLGWAVDEVEVVSAVARPLARVRRVLAPGARVLVLSEDAATPAAVAGLLVGAGYGASAMTVLEQLGGPDERRTAATARDWVHPPGDPLNVVAVECGADPGAPVRAARAGPARRRLRPRRPAHQARGPRRHPGALGPRPGELLWDVGAGNGSIAIEWLRAHRTCRAVAVETRRGARRADRGERRARSGVPRVRVVRGRAPGRAGRAADAGRRLHRWRAHDPGRARRAAGRRCVRAAGSWRTPSRWRPRRSSSAGRAARGGDLTRLEVSRAAPLGGFTGWRPAMPVTIWAVQKSLP